MGLRGLLDAFLGRGHAWHVPPQVRRRSSYIHWEVGSLGVWLSSASRMQRQLDCLSFSLGFGLKPRWTVLMAFSHSGDKSLPSSLLILHPGGASSMCRASFTTLSLWSVAESSSSTCRQCLMKNFTRICPCLDSKNLY